MIGRLKPGVTTEAAASQLTTIYKPLLEEELKAFRDATKNFAERFTARKIMLQPGALGRANLRNEAREPLQILIAITAFVLLIACANVAGLLIARATARTREIAIRLSLGASRGVLMRQLMAESLVLCLAGGFFAIIFAVWTSDGIVYLLPRDGDGTNALTATLNGRILLFHMGLSMLTGLLFGLAPAIQASRADVAPALKDQSNAVSGSGGHVRIRRALVAAQIAVSMLLLVGAGLFARTVYNLRNVDPGFRSEQLVQFEVNASMLGHPTARVHDTYRRLGEKLAATPGIYSVSAAQQTLMTNSIMSSTIRVAGYKHKENEDMNPWMNYITPGYFATLGVPLINGRDFNTADGLKAPKVAIVNETFVRYFFGKDNPLGRTLTIGRDDTPTQIVGVVRDMRHGDLKEEVHRFVYLPYAQADDPSGIAFYVRTPLQEAAVANLIRRTVRDIEPNLPVVNLRPVKEQVVDSIGSEQMIATLSAAFASLATLLAAIGLYGVMAYSVARRTREIGIRIALGALQGRVVWLVMREVATLLAVGVVVGLPAAYLLGKYAESQLFGMKSYDPVVMVAAAICLAVVAAFAGFIPARKATRIDPLKALRYE
jgi:predicted permease